MYIAVGEQPYGLAHLRVTAVSVPVLQFARVWKCAMAFVPFNNVIKLEAIFTLAGQRVQNVHNYLVDETPNVDTCQALMGSYLDWYNGSLAPLQPPACQLVLMRATIMEEENSPGVENAAFSTANGIHNSEPLPNSVTAAIRWVTGFRGRSYRGRTYHIGLTEDQVQGNTITSETVTALQVAYGELMSLPVDVGPAVMCICSRVSHGVERTVGVATPVLNVVVDNVVDSQRRRLPGRGR